MRRIWFVAGVGLLTLAAFGLWLQTHKDETCVSCVAKEDNYFFQIFSSPTHDPLAREAKFKSLLEQSYPHFRVAITQEEASFPDVQAYLKLDSHKFVVLPAGFSPQELMYNWVHSIPESDIAIMLSDGKALDGDALKNLMNIYASSDAWSTTSYGLLTGYVHLFQKIDTQDFTAGPEKRLSEIASGHVYELSGVSRQ